MLRPWGPRGRQALPALPVLLAFCLALLPAPAEPLGISHWDLEGANE